MMEDISDQLPRIDWNLEAMWGVAKWWVSNYSPFVMIATGLAVTFAIVSIIAWLMSDKEEEEDKGYDEHYY